MMALATDTRTLEGDIWYPSSCLTTSTRTCDTSPLKARPNTTTDKIGPNTVNNKAILSLSMVRNVFLVMARVLFMFTRFPAL
jgi:hypothetical protein